MQLGLEVQAIRRHLAPPLMQHLKQMTQIHATYVLVISVSPLPATKAALPRHHTERPDCEQRKQPDHFHPSQGPPQPYCILR